MALAAAATRPMECDPSFLVYDYESAVVPGLRVSLYFTDLDVPAERLVLVQVRHEMLHPPPN